MTDDSLEISDDARADMAAKWPAMNIELRPTESLNPYENNSRTHTEDQIEQICVSIQEWGWTNPVLVDESGTIIAGHGRVRAATKLGIEQVPVMTARGWSEEQIAAYVIADNKLALNAGWDNEVLAAEFEKFTAAGFDFTKTGFSAEEAQEVFFDGNFDPGSADDQGRLDELAPKLIKCPHCSKEINLRKVKS